MIEVREANVSDKEGLWHLLQAMHQESPRHREYPLDTASCDAMLEAAIRDQRALVLAAFDGADMVGGAIAYLSVILGTTTAISSELILYVRPEYRGTTAAVRLATAIESWADENGAVEKQAGVSVGIDNARAVEFYKRLGYQVVGVMLAK